MRIYQGQGVGEGRWSIRLERAQGAAAKGWRGLIVAIRGKLRRTRAP